MGARKKKEGGQKIALLLAGSDSEMLFSNCSFCLDKGGKETALEKFE